MKNYRKNLMILVITFLFSLTLGGCSWPNDNNVVKDIDNTTNQIMDQARNGINALESVAYLGIKDADLAAAKGEGLITRTTVGEEATIVSREYDERVFDIETRGKYMVDAIKARNYPVISGGVICLAVLFSLVTILVDVLYAFVDPQVKAMYKGATKSKRKKEGAENG